MWHKAEWPQVRDIRDGEAARRRIEPPTQSQSGSTTQTITPPQSESLERWYLGKEDKVLGLPGRNLEFTFQSTSCTKKPAQLQNTIYSASGQRLFRGGDSTTNWESASALGTACTAVPSKHGHHRLGATEVEKNLCAVKSAVEKKLFFQSI